MFKPKTIVKLATCIACISAILSSPATSFQDESRKATNQLTVRLNVLVTDTANQFVRDLRKEDFKITDDGTPREISFFSSAELPISYGLLIDTSGRSRNFLSSIGEIITRLTSGHKKGDSAFIMRFAGKKNVQILQDWTEDRDQLIGAVRGLKSEGYASLLDSIYECIEHLDPHAPFESVPARHKTLIVITDSDDHGSQNSESALIRRVRDQDVQILVLWLPQKINIPMLDPEPFYPESDGLHMMERIAKASGGELFPPPKHGDPLTMADILLDRIRNQYVIGYHPGNPGDKDKYHKIKIELVKKPGQDKYIVKTRPGYSKTDK